LPFLSVNNSFSLWYFCKIYWQSFLWYKKNENIFGV
jgi:hypothetical protein